MTDSHPASATTAAFHSDCCHVLPPLVATTNGVVDSPFSHGAPSPPPFGTVGGNRPAALRQFLEAPGVPLRKRVKMFVAVAPSFEKWMANCLFNLASYCDRRLPSLFRYSLGLFELR